MKKYDIPEYEIEKFMVADILTKSNWGNLTDTEEGNYIDGGSGDIIPF